MIYDPEKMKFAVVMFLCVVSGCRRRRRRRHGLLRWIRFWVLHFGRKGGSIFGREVVLFWV